jgi:hypothetical protein
MTIQVQRTTARTVRPERLITIIMPVLAVAGAALTLTRLVWWWEAGGWPPHDSSAYWLAGIHLREGAPVYGALAGDYLAFLYAPPLAVVFGVLSFLPLGVLSALILVGQILALRYVMGSWIAVGIVGWLPIIADELSIGNVDFIMAAVILAGVCGRAGPAVALFAFAKLSPVLVLSRATWRGAVIAGLVLVALTLPWLHLWPEWLGVLAGSRDNLNPEAVVPILPRIPVVLVLLALRRPWAIAGAAALATPAFYFHSLVLLLPAVRLWVATSRSRRP